MYEQIKSILKQNNISYSHIVWNDEFGNIQLDNNLEWTQYIEDSKDGGILFYFGEEKRYFKAIQRVGLGFTNIILLEEEVELIEEV